MLVCCKMLLGNSTEDEKKSLLLFDIVLKVTFNKPCLTSITRLSGSGSLIHPPWVSSANVLLKLLFDYSWGSLQKDATTFEMRKLFFFKWTSKFSERRSKERQLGELFLKRFVNLWHQLSFRVEVNRRENEASWCCCRQHRTIRD